MTNYYTILEIEDFSSLETIKSAHRKLSMKYHPDRNKGDKLCEEKFKVIQNAYEHLSGSYEKQIYDEQLAAWLAYKNDPANNQYYYTAEQHPTPAPTTRRKYGYPWIFILAFSSVVYSMLNSNLSPDSFTNTPVIFHSNNGGSDLDQTIKMLSALDSEHAANDPANKIMSADNETLFTIGSTKQHVIEVQGYPLAIQWPDINNKEVWFYKNSSVTFRDGFVIEYSNADDNLNVSMSSLPAYIKKAADTCFTIGSSKDQVLAVQPTPGAVKKFDITREEVWSYGLSSVTFKNGIVIAYSNEGKNLHIKYLR